MQIKEICLISIYDNLVIPPLLILVQKQYHNKLKYTPPGGVDPDTVAPARTHPLTCM